MIKLFASTYAWQQRALSRWPQLMSVKPSAAAGSSCNHCSDPNTSRKMATSSDSRVWSHQLDDLTELLEVYYMMKKSFQTAIFSRDLT
jgi:hypothetical protein